MSVRILLADDHRILRQGLRQLLESYPDMEVVGEATHGREAVERALDLRPDVAIMDIGMPELNGIEATRQIRAELPGTRVIALSMHADARFVGRMLEAGATGYLLKDCAFEELQEAVNEVRAGRMFLSSGITGIVVEDYLHRLQRDNTEGPVQILTPKEREILQSVAEGKSTKEIAHGLGVSVKTIETHRQNVMRKLDLHSVAELTKYAIREGLTSLED